MRLILLQMRAREEREAKRSRMDGRHEFILSTVADNLDMRIEEAEDFMLEGSQVSNALLREVESPNVTQLSIAGRVFQLFCPRGKEITDVLL